MAALREQGLIRGEEPYVHSVPFSHRSGERIEPLISLQWFCRMDELAKPAIEVVERGQVRFVPEQLEARLPRLDDATSAPGASRASSGGGTGCRSGTATPARRPTSPRRRPSAAAPAAASCARTRTCWTPGSAPPCGRSRSSAGPTRRPELRAFYPTDVLVTARDIIFLWVARMVMMGLEFAGEIPFEDVYITSVIQAPDGRRMSKSLGTGIDPLDEIEAHGADARPLRAARHVLGPGRALFGGPDPAGTGPGEQDVERVATDPAQRLRRPRGARRRTGRPPGGSRIAGSSPGSRRRSRP